VWLSLFPVSVGVFNFKFQVKVSYILVGLGHWGVVGITTSRGYQQIKLHTVSINTNGAGCSES